jgi:YHS domain-containing protein
MLGVLILVQGALLMPERTIQAGTWLVLLVVMLLVSCGCRKDTPTAAESARQPATPAEKSAVADVEIQTILAKADEVDGKADKVVSKCAICALSMDGSPEHSLETAGYTLHFCSAHCKDAFAHDATKSILAMKFPQK